MERYNLNLKDQDLSKAFEHIFNNGMGKPIVVDNAPTSSTLKVGEPQYYGGYMYLKFPDGTCKKFQGSSL